MTAADACTVVGKSMFDTLSGSCIVDVDGRLAGGGYAGAAMPATIAAVSASAVTRWDAGRGNGTRSGCPRTRIASLR